MKSHNILKEKIGNRIVRDVDIAHCVSGVDVIKNNVEARCQVIKGELPYNTLLGIPLHQDKEDIDLSVLNIITNTYGVQDITRFNSSLSHRKYSANAIIQSMYGTAEVEL